MSRRTRGRRRGGSTGTMRGHLACRDILGKGRLAEARRFGAFWRRSEGETPLTYDVLMPARGMPIIAERIAARATLHRPSEAPDAAVALAEIAPRIRALVVT